MQTDTHIASARPSFATILWRLSRPFFLFCFVFASLMTVSLAFLLPRYTSIDVGGALRNAAQIRAYRAELTSQIAAKEEERRRLVLAVHDPQYDALKERRRNRVPLAQLRKQLMEHAVKITERENVVHWKYFAYDPEGKTLNVRGEVRNVETRSMTILAALVQSLNHLSFVASVTTPTFTRKEDPKNGPISPFDITLTLR